MMRRMLIFAFVALLAVGVPASAQQPPLPVSQTFTFFNATTTAGTSSAMQVQNIAVLGIQVVKSGNYTGLLTFQGSLDNTTYVAITCYPQGSSTGSTTAANTTAGIYRCNTLGIMYVRVVSSAVTAGTGALTVRGFGTSLGPLPVDVP